MPTTPPVIDEERVLHVLSDPRPECVALLELVVADAQARGVRCAVAATEHSLVPLINSFDAAFHRLFEPPGTKRSIARNGRTLRTVIDRISPTVVHLHDLGAAKLFRVATVTTNSPAAVMSVHEGEPSYRTIARFLNRTTWTAIAAGPTVGHSLRSCGYQGRLRTVLTGGSWTEPSRNDVAEARARWGLDEPYLVASATDQHGPEWPALLSGLQRFEGIRLAVVGEPAQRPAELRQSGAENDLYRWVPAPEDFGVLAAGSLGVVSPVADRPTTQILGPLSIGVPVVAGRNPALQGSVPADAAIVIDYAADTVAEAIALLVDHPRRRTLGARGRDAARVWSPTQAAAGFAELYQSKAATAD